jgi:hypothetical protein
MSNHVTSSQQTLPNLDLFENTQNDHKLAQLTQKKKMIGQQMQALLGQQRLLVEEEKEILKESYHKALKKSNYKRTNSQTHLAPLRTNTRVQNENRLW